MDRRLLEDLDLDDRAQILALQRNIDNKFLNLFRRFHLSQRINRIVNLPFKNVWINSLESVISDPKTEYHVIFMSPFYPIEKSFVSNLNRLKKNYRVKCHLFMIDPLVEAPLAEEYKAKIDFENIFTYDEKDAKRHGFSFHYVLFSMLGEPCSEIKYDLYFAGNKRADGGGSFGTIAQYL